MSHLVGCAISHLEDFRNLLRRVADISMVLLMGVGPCVYSPDVREREHKERIIAGSVYLKD